MRVFLFLEDLFDLRLFLLPPSLTIIGNNLPSKYLDCGFSSSSFEAGDFIDGIGTSKGKGFQGVVKRHGFGGVGGQTHGQHNRARHPGSVGACSFPARVFRGLKMAGRTGGTRVKVQNLRILKLIPEKNLILVSGSLPGHNNSFVILEK